MKIRSFYVREIARIPSLPGYMGSVEIGLERADGETVNVAVARVRINHEGPATFEEIERLLFEEARDHLTQAAQLLSQETAESLHQVAEDRL